MRPVLVLDLDGTVALGDSPVLGYARAIESLAPAVGDLVGAVRRFLADPAADSRLSGAQDGYQAVHLLSDAAGVTDPVRNAAYRQSRALLDADSGDVAPPEGLRDLLATLDAHLVLITNSPEAGLATVLARLGLTGLLDEVRTDAGKPTGMAGLLTELLTRYDIWSTPGRLLSVGDIWANDLEPALQLGCATAYVDTYDRRQGPAHVRAHTLPELYPSLRHWAADPDGFLRAHPLPTTSLAGVTECPGPSH